MPICSVLYDLPRAPATLKGRQRLALVRVLRWTLTHSEQVFPWVVADYSSAELDLDDPACFRDLSLPMGALDPTRLATYQQRFIEMPQEEVTCVFTTSSTEPSADPSPTSPPTFPNHQPSGPHPKPYTLSP